MSDATQRNRFIYPLTVLVSVLFVWVLAFVQIRFVYNMVFGAQLLVIPTIVAVSFGAVMSRLIVVGRRLRQLGVELATRERLISDLNRDLEARVEQRTAELTRKTEQLLQAQRLELVGRMASGVAHDYNNVLTVVQICSQILRPAVALIPDPLFRQEAVESLDDLDRAAQSARNLSAELLTFTRQKPGAVAEVDVRAVIEAQLPLLRRILGARASLQLELPGSASPSPLLVRGNRTQLEQLLLNLTVNARDAMSEGGVVTVTAARDAAEIVLRVSDSGCGMDKATAAQIFEPFFTTKAEGKGSGLGLSVVQEVVRQSGGLISVDSAPGRGTTFEVRLPALGEAGGTSS